MTVEADVEDKAALATRPDAGVSVDVALGRRVMVVGDLLLPSTPSASSRAACRDIAQTLSEWQGPRHRRGLRPVGGHRVPRGTGAGRGPFAPP